MKSKKEAKRNKIQEMLNYLTDSARESIIKAFGKVEDMHPTSLNTIHGLVERTVKWGDGYDITPENQDKYWRGK